MISVCLAPSHIDSVYRLASTESSITVGWDIPTAIEVLGGCPILGFSLYMDNVEVDALEINNKPYLNVHTVSGLTQVGQFYSFKIQIHNEIGSYTSLETSF